MFVLKIRDAFYNSPTVYIVTELMRGGELFDKIRQEKSLSERESAKIMFVIIKTIEQLHRNSIGKIIINHKNQTKLKIFVFF